MANVTVSGIDVTITSESFGGADLPPWKLLAIDPTNSDATFAELNNKSFADWSRSGNPGAEYSSYIETGYFHFDAPNLDKQPIYVDTFLAKTSKTQTIGGFFEAPTIPNISTTCGLFNSGYSGKNKLTTDSSTGTTTSGLVFSPDGTKMFVGNSGPDSAFEYSLSTAFDVTSATYSVKSLNFGAVNTLMGLRLNPTGTMIFGLDTKNFHPPRMQYATLSTPYDLDSAGTVSESGDIPDLDPTDNIKGFEFMDSGNSIIIVDDDNNTLRQYSLPAPYTTTSFSLVGSVDISSETTSPRGLSMSSSGTTLFLMSPSAVYEYRLSNPASLASLTYSGNSFSVASELTTAVDIWVAPDRDKFYVLDEDTSPLSKKRVYQYDNTCVQTL